MSVGRLGCEDVRRTAAGYFVATPAKLFLSNCKTARVRNKEQGAAITDAYTGNIGAKA